MTLLIAAGKEHYIYKYKEHFCSAELHVAIVTWLLVHSLEAPCTILWPVLFFVVHGVALPKTPPHDTSLSMWEQQTADDQQGDVSFLFPSRKRLIFGQIGH